MMYKGCVTLKGDILDQLWQGLNFYNIIQKNEINYLYIFGSIDQDAFDSFLKSLKSINDEY